MSKDKSQRGMTLIEVLVAMVVLATAVGTLLSLLSIYTRNVVAIQDRALARIVAENAMVEVVVEEKRLRRREEGGMMEAGGRNFIWTLSRVPAPTQGLDILIITVTAESGDQVLASLDTVRPQ